ncbi:MAG: hypothetical protein ABSB40_10725 [Nitrososphaeria archaeon]
MSEIRCSGALEDSVCARGNELRVIEPNMICGLGNLATESRRVDLKLSVKSRKWEVRG